HLRHCVRCDAVLLLAGSRRGVRSLRPATGHLALESWPWSRLHRDGAFAHTWLALSRPDHLWNYGLQHSDGNGLHRRRRSKREARGRVWDDWSGVWPGFYPGTSGWWSTRRPQPASAILDRCRFSLLNWVYGFFFVPESLPP